MLGFLIVFIGLSLLVLVHELGHFWAAKYFKMPVEEFGIGFPPRLFSTIWEGTRYSVNALPLGGFVKLHGELEDAGAGSFINQKPWKRVIVLIAGVCMNFIAGWLIFSAVFWVGVPSVIVINQVTPDSPAAHVGLRQGDIINISDFVNPNLKNVNEFIDFINEHKGKEIVLNVERAGKEFQLNIVPRANPPVGEGALGVALQGGGIPRAGFFTGLYRGLVMAGVIAWSVVQGLASLFTAPQNIVGPVGIFSIAVSTGKIGFIYVLQLLGVISLNLAVLNLLPIPALDGGRLLFIIIEKLRGKPFRAHTEQHANAIGFMFLIALIIGVTVKDVAGFF